MTVPPPAAPPAADPAPAGGGRRSDGWDDLTPSLRRAGNPFAFCIGPRRSHDAEAALALGLVGLLCFGLPSPIAIYYGVRALKQFRGSEEEPPGRWEAVAGLTLGIVGVAQMVIGVIVVFALCRAL